MILKKIVNIMPDDKFLDYYIEMSEKFLPDASTYLVLSKSHTTKNIKSKNSNIFRIEKEIFKFEQLAEKLCESSVIIFHSFSFSDKEFIFSLSNNIKKIWLFWGFEGYSAIPKAEFLGWKSHFATYPKSVKGFIQFALSRLKSNFVTNANLLPRRMIQRMDYCATWVKEDFILAKRINPNLKYLYFCYYTQDLMNFPSVSAENTDLSKLFLGNSGAPTNNHIEALLYLYDCGYNGEIFCPLSYGGGEQYVNNVINLGKKLFSHRFKPLNDFMPLDEYQKIIASSGIVWMNHKRQQGAGNLFAALYTGKIVITDSANPLNVTFTEWGLFHYSKHILNNLESVNMKLLTQNQKKIENKLTIGSNKSFFDELEVLLS